MEWLEAVVILTPVTILGAWAQPGSSSTPCDLGMGSVGSSAMVAACVTVALGAGSQLEAQWGLSPRLPWFSSMWPFHVIRNS